MNEIFADKLRRLNEDKIMFEAIKCVIDERIEKEKPIVESADSNFGLGEKYRAYIQAKKLFELILIDIEAHRDRKVDSDKFNKGK